MKILLFGIVLAAGQIGTLQNKPIMHLQSTRTVIGPEFGGTLLELNDSAVAIALPVIPPRLDSKGKPWSIDIKNLGPRSVTIVGKDQFSVLVNIGRTIHVFSNGTTYSLK